MNRQTLFYLFIVIATVIVVWYILGGSGAPFSSYVRYSGLVLVCQGGLYFADKYGRETNGRH